MVLEDGRIIEGKYIIDGRGEFPKTYPMGYQKFLGQYLVLEKPHGLKYPILMDATCEQIGGFRFFYVLPWDQTKLLVEDTRYSTDKDLPENQMRQEIRNFCFKRGWQIAFVSQEEIGCLPIPLGGESPASNQLIKSGSSAGLFHATTGYSLGFAIKFASRLVCYLEKPPIVERIFQDSIGHWKRNRLFRLLNRMLFHKSPDRRYEILQRFYSLPKSLVGRFYAGELTGMDKLRIFWGMPPITFRKVLSSIFSPLGLNEYRV